MSAPLQTVVNAQARLLIKLTRALLAGPMPDVDEGHIKEIDGLTNELEKLLDQPSPVVEMILNGLGLNPEKVDLEE